MTPPESPSAEAMSSSSSPSSPAASELAAAVSPESVAAGAGAAPVAGGTTVATGTALVAAGGAKAGAGAVPAHDARSIGTRRRPQCFMAERCSQADATAPVLGRFWRGGCARVPKCVRTRRMRLGSHRRLHTLVLSLSLVAGTLAVRLDVFAGSKPSMTFPKDSVALPLEKYTLDNGLEVILHEDHRTPVVAVNIWYHVGSKDEAGRQNGFAHLFEHLMFQGSQARRRGHVLQVPRARRRERAQRHDQRRPHQLLRDGARRTSSSSRSGSRAIAWASCSITSTRRRSRASARS